MATTIRRAANRAVVEHYREKGLKTEADVFNLLKFGLCEPLVSTKKICNRPDHVSQFRFVSDVLLRKVQDYIVWANRSGSKSYLAGLITWVNASYYPFSETVILGGSLEQSEKSYQAMSTFWDITELQGRYLIGDPNQRWTIWKNKSNVHILTASTKSTRGPHPQCLAKDTLIMTRQGEKRISDIMPHDEIIAWDGCKLTSGLVLLKRYAGKQRITELRLSTGRTIKCTEDHEFLTSNGWKKAEDISETDLLVGKNKGLHEMWKAASPQVFENDNGAVQGMLFDSGKRTDQILHRLRKRVKQGFKGSVLGLLVNRKEEDKGAVCGLWKRIKAAFERKMPIVLGFAFNKGWNDQTNGGRQSDRFKKWPDLESGATGYGIIFGTRSQIRAPGSDRQIHRGFQNREPGNRDSRSILARPYEGERTRHFEEGKIERDGIFSSVFENRKHAYVVERNYEYVQIISKKRLGLDQVWDLYIPKFHSFLAEGVVVHNCLLMDEIDEMDEEVYTSALSQPQSKFGIPATTGKLSTNHRINGIMDLAIKKAEEQSIPIYKWCIWDGIESCVDYSCSTCKLSSLCPGEQMKGATGYYKIEDCIQKLHNVSMATFSLEWLCEKTGRSDLIYGSQYNEKIHSSESAPDFNPGKKTILSLDWGGTLPFTAGAWQKFPIGWVRVDEVVVENTTNKRFIEACSKKPWWRTVREAVADPARADLISEWKELRIPGHGPIWVYQADNSVLPGIEAVRDCLAPVFGLPKFYVNKKCKYWIMEAGNYAEKNGKPVKAFDHTMDDTRYFVTRYIKPLKRMRIRGLS